jgi:hypothetical protein
VAEKLALVSPAATVTEVGTVTSFELLDRVTTWPPVGAAAFSSTLQPSVAAPVSDELIQPSPLSAAEVVSVMLALPVPSVFFAVRATTEDPAVVGVPEINPVELFNVSPAGNPVAL